MAQQVLEIWAQPNASQTEVVGPHAGALRVRLAVPAVGGRANRELLRCLAAHLGLRPRALELRRGTRSRRKWIVFDSGVELPESWQNSVREAS